MSKTTENNILLHLTGKETAGNVSMDELIEITDKYPAFGLAKFLLAKKMKEEKHAGFEMAAQKAILHFPNSFWFHFKLNEDELMEGGIPVTQQKTEALKEIGVTEPIVLEEPAEASIEQEQPVTSKHIAVNTVDELALLLETTITEDPVPVESEDEGLKDQFEQQTLNEDKPALELVEQITPEEAEPKLPEEQLQQPVQEETPIHDTVVMEQPITEEIITELPGEQLQEPVEEETPIHDTVVMKEPVPEEIVPELTQEQLQQPVHEETPAYDEIVIEEAVPEEIIPELPVEQLQQPALNEMLAGEPVIVEQPPVPEEVKTEYVKEQLQQPLPEEQFSSETDPDETDGSFEDADAERESAIPLLPNDKISAILKEQLEDFKKPIEAEAPIPIETEPFHTVDYFASQGIRLSLEQQKQDHLSVKVKKFTDWLKQMKRINPTPIDLGIDEAAEHRIKDSAASSNEPKEVLTETMAEIFEKQGMTEKAIQVYIKLSFLDPSKSAYFASKIEQLKGI